MRIGLDTGTVQCADKSLYEKYMAAHKAEQVSKKREDFDTLQNEVSELKSDMSEIKSLLLTLVQKQNIITPSSLWKKFHKRVC